MATTAPTTEMLRNLPVAKHRDPDGAPTWPRILVTGPTGGRKSGAAVDLSADERLGKMFWLEIGRDNVTANEYGALPGARYTMIEHDGTWTSIVDQLGAHWKIAKAAEERGEKPIPLTVDAMQGPHEMLNSMADTRARRKLANYLKGKGQNPQEAWKSERDVKIGFDLRQLVKDRHAYFMWFVHNWPGPVTLISAEEPAAVFEDGEPTGEIGWALKCRKDLPGQVSAWVRLQPGKTPLLLKLRTVHLEHAVNFQESTDDDKPNTQERADFTLARLIFEWAGCVAGESKAPEHRELDADQDAPGEVPADPAEDDTSVRLGAEKILGVRSLRQAEHYLKITEGNGLGERDVTHLDSITDQDREVLGLPATVTLLELNTQVVEYCRRHGDDHRCDGMEHVSAHGPRSAPETPGTPIQAGNGVAAAVS